MSFRIASLRAVALASTATIAAACSSSRSTSKTPEDQRAPGQTTFQSAPPGGNRSGGASNASAPKDAGAVNPERTVEETDLYRLDGDRLYYLNSYRGLMVFDVSNVDQPKLLGRSAIYGSPVEMVVRNGVAVVVVGDWYGRNVDGSPFHGSVVRGLDARDPANIKSTGEAMLGGWVRDTRVVGDVLYAVSEDYGWYYGIWAYGYGGWGGVGVADAPVGISGGGAQGAKVVVSSVSFANGQIAAKGRTELGGYQAIFNVTNSSIMLAHDVPSDPNTPYSQPSGTVELQYIDINDPNGTIALRGKATVNGSLAYGGADNGRWNLDFADKRYAHVLSCSGKYCGNGDYILSTVDFFDPNAPKLASELAIARTGWSGAARFDGARMYLSPDSGYASSQAMTPLEIFDLSNATAPKLAGSTDIPGTAWNIIPSGDRLFVLGNEYGVNYSSEKVSLKYLDVSDATKPTLLGSATFGEGWAWTPAAGTFKAFTKDDTQGLVVLPFSGWSGKSSTYNNGLQLIEFSPTTIRTAGAAKTKGWVERGIFVKGRLVSLSDLALSVVDYTDRNNPRVVKELTLARNVVSAQPQGATIAQLSSDWWGNDSTTSEMRVLPIADAEESSEVTAVSLDIEGTGARAFRNGDLAYIVSDVSVTVPCGTGGPSYPTPDGKTPTCRAYTPQVQIVDLSNGQARARGKIQLPIDPNMYSYWSWGWGGFYWYDWYEGADAVQVEGSVLAFRRWSPVYTQNGRWSANQKLYVVDLKNTDAPQIASTLITDDDNGWWGNMRAVGDKLYTSHYEWVTFPTESSPQGIVRYYLDQIDLSDRSDPKVGLKINVPGMLVGASETDPSLLYTIDYRWFGNDTHDELSVVRIQNDMAYLQSTTSLTGWVGNVFVRGTKAYTSVERYVEPKLADGQVDPNAGPRISLHELDLTNPQAPVDRVSSEKRGWGWLLGVEGDRAIVTSGWGNNGIDIFKLSPDAPPAFDQFVRTRGWWTSSLARQGDQLFLSSGYWGVQTVNLK